MRIGSRWHCKISSHFSPHSNAKYGWPLNGKTRRCWWWRITLSLTLQTTSINALFTHWAFRINKSLVAAPERLHFLHSHGIAYFKYLLRSSSWCGLLHKMNNDRTVSIFCIFLRLERVVCRANLRLGSWCLGEEFLAVDRLLTSQSECRSNNFIDRWIICEPN